MLYGWELQLEPVGALEARRLTQAPMEARGLPLNGQPVILRLEASHNSVIYTMTAATATQHGHGMEMIL